MQHHVDLCNKQLNTWMEEEVKRQKEVEAICNPIISKLYQQGGAPGGGMHNGMSSGMPNGMHNGMPNGNPNGMPKGTSDSGPTIEEVD